MQEKIKNKKKIFWLIFLTPFIILLLSFFSFRYQWFISDKTVNKGILLEKAVHISQLFNSNLSHQIDEVIQNKDQELARKFKRNWLLLTLNFDDNCSKVCQDRLYLLKQMHLSMSKNYFRLIRAYINSVDLKAENSKLYQALEPVYTIQANLSNYKQKINQVLNANSQLNIEQDKIISLLIDPLGNIVTLYKLKHSYKDIYTDITKLLKYSKIG